MSLTDRPTARPLLAAVTAGIACLGLAACGGSDDSPTVSAPTTTTTTSSVPATPSSSPTTDETSSAPATGDTKTSDFQVGQCYDDTTNWSLTPCSQPHKLEISAVVKTTQYANDIVKRGVLRTWTCNNKVAGYVGGGPSSAFSLILSQPVPTAVDTKSGEQIACAVAEQSPDDSGYQELTTPLKNRIAHKGYVPYRLCTSDRPSKTDSPKIVPCTEPHQAETIGGFVIGKPDGKYPGTKAVNKAALSHCVPLAKKYLGAVRSDIIASANSTGQNGWSQGTTMTACFAESTKGNIAKPLKGIKQQPLSKFQ